MASKPRDLVTRFLSDVRGFLRGTDQMADAMQDLVDDQARVVREGQDAGRDLGVAYERASDKIKRETREAGRVSKQQLGDAGKEAGSEFAQNLGESISSGDVSGLVSGTVGGLAGTFGAAGPIGLALAGLGALGVSIFNWISAAAAKAAQDAQAAYDDIQSGATREARRQTQLETAFGKGSLIANQSEALALADRTGVAYERIVDYITDGNRGQAELRALQDEINALTQRNVDQAGDLTVKESQRLRALEDLLNVITRSSDGLRTAAEHDELSARSNQTSADAVERRAAAARRQAAADERSAAAFERSAAALVVAADAMARLARESIKVDTRAGTVGTGGGRQAFEDSTSARYATGSRQKRP